MKLRRSYSYPYPQRQDDYTTTLSDQAFSAIQIKLFKIFLVSFSGHDVTSIPANGSYTFFSFFFLALNN
jgi:hypothetical protein